MPMDIKIQPLKINSQDLYINEMGGIIWKILFVSLLVLLIYSLLKPT